MMRNAGLDVVRAVAILCVLAVHFLTGPYSEYRGAITWAGYLGYFGVELFFVLSGYLVGRIMRRVFDQPFDGPVVWNFYVRRAMRTFPLYFVVLGLEVWWAAEWLGDVPRVVAAHWPYLVFGQNLAWPMTDSFFGVSWSLTIEEWFYVGFPLMFALLAAVGIRRRVLAVAVGCVVGCLLLRHLLYHPGVDWDAFMRKAVVLRLDAIAFGVLAAIAMEKVRLAGWRPWALAGAGIAGMAFLLMARGWHGTIGLEFYFTGYFTLTSFVLALFLPVAELWHGAVRRMRWFDAASRWMSTHAYSLYLAHPLILAVMARHHPHSSLAEALAVYAGGSALAATILHRTIERPIMNRRPKERAAASGRGAPIPPMEAAGSSS